jgi:type IV secretion system protein TrbL
MMIAPFFARPFMARSYLRWSIVGLIGMWLLLAAGSAIAQAQQAPLPFNILDKIGETYNGTNGGKAFQWSEVIRVYAIRLFLLLAAIDFGWLCANFIFEKKELEDMVYSVAKKLMTLSFFFFLLMSSNTWIPQVINSFAKIGKEASGTNVSTPDGIAANGFDAAIGVFQIMGDLDLGEQLVAVLPAVGMALLIFLAFLWTAAQLLVAQIESSIAIGAGIILMGFGGSRWTTDMATKYKQYVVATGVKLMLMYIIVGTGATLFDDIKLVRGEQFLSSMLVAAGSALMYAFLATKVPAMASGMMSGSPSMSAGDLMGAAIGAGAAIAGLGAAGAAMGKAGAGALGGGAAAATGVGQALGAGLQSGMDMGKSGAGLAAHALGEVGSHGLGMASGAIGDRLAGGSAGFGEMVANSTGGRIATSIQASRGGSMAGVAGPGGAESQGRATAPAPGTASASTPAGVSTSSPSSAASAAATSAAGSTAPVQSAASTGAGQSSPHAAAARGAAVGSAAPSAGSAPASAAGTTSNSASSAPISRAAPPGAREPSMPSAAPERASSEETSGNMPAAAPADLSSSAGSSETPNGSGQGDASNGSLSGGDERKAASQEQRDRDPLHRRIQELKGYVPDDAAHSATLQININHTQ